MTHRSPSPAALVEREPVLSSIAARLDDATAGRGGTIVLHGAPGLGKTTVLRHAIDGVRDGDSALVVARGGELEQRMPWAIVRTLLRDLAAGAPQLVGPAAGAVLGLGGGQTGDDVAALFDLTELCLGLASRQPLVLVVDDAHWADRGSARFLAYLAARIADVPLGLLVAERPDDPRRPRELLSLAKDDVLALRLAPLSEAGTAQLVTAAMPGAGDDVAAACHRATGGNLFLLAELTRELAARGTTPTAAAIDEVEIAAIDRAVARRLAAAGDAAARLARAASVLGHDGQLADAAAIAGLEYAAAAHAADALRAAGLFAAGGPGEPAMAFGHPLLLTAVRRTIPPGERSLLHLAAARRLESVGAAPDRVGALLLDSEPGGDPWARDRLVAAADRALAAGAAPAAVALLQRAVAERTETPGVELQTRLGRAALAVDPALAEGPLRAALRMAPDAETRLDVALTLSIALQMLRRSGEATDMLLALDDELAAGGAPRSSRLRVQAEALAQSFFDPRTRPLRAARLPGLAAELDGGCDEELLVHVQVAIDAVNNQTADAVRALSERAWADGALQRLAGAPETPTVMWIPYMRLYVDDYAWTAALMDDWLTQARERGSAVLATFGHALLAQARTRAGALRDAVAAADAGWQVAREFDPQFPGWWIALGTLAQAQVCAGDAGAARALLDTAGLLDGPPPDVMLMPAPRVVRAEVLLATGDTERATSELLDSWAWIEGEGTPSPGGWWFPTALVDGLLVLGRTAEAEDVARTWLARTEAFGAASTLGQAQRSLGLALGDAHGLEWLERAEATLAASPARAEHARALLELGAALRRLRRPSDAREPLRRALDLSAKCGATALGDRARTELVAAGARPRRDASIGRDALTASERRVATLAAAGRTNREIANTLFISRKTVETHLAHVYLKLGDNDRTHLAELLAGSD